MQLMAGERVVWSGQPKGGLAFVPMDIFLVPFSLLWTSFAVFWNVSVWTSGAPLVMQLFGLPFLLVGAYFVVGRFVVDAMVRASTRYSVTNQRVLIERGFPFRTQRSLDIRRLPALELRESGDGSGTIRFGIGSGQPFGRNGFGGWSPSFDDVPQFFRIPSVRNVYTVIERESRYG